MNANTTTPSGGVPEGWYDEHNVNWPGLAFVPIIVILLPMCCVPCCLHWQQTMGDDAPRQNTHPGSNGHDYQAVPTGSSTN